jgi:glycerol-3-phosphate acyltransferase PlsY
VGVFAAISPLAVLVAAVIFVVVVALTRYISLGSILAAASMPLWTWLWQRGDPELPQMLTALSVSAALIIGKHHENIRRLVGGNENKFAGKS